MNKYLRPIAIFLSLLTALGCHHAPRADGFDVESHYDKHEYDIPMRDGVTLHTVVYVPNDHSESYPFLVKRTPYSAGPYGPGEYLDHLGPTGSDRFAEEGFIFVYQDVRGRFLSQGKFLHVTPHVAEKSGPQEVDESSDMYDTVEWLLENVQPNNGRVGLWGISYPGFYAAASIVDTHPAIKAASPQAAVINWFVGDDFHHNGAFYLQDAFGFFHFFESPGPNPVRSWGRRFEFGTEDAYQFFLDMGPLSNANERHFHHGVAFWDALMEHGTYDDFWKSRDILPHLANVNTNVMTVGGWFDAEDPYGPIHVYRAIEEKNPGINNTVVLGPWFHGGWVRSDGDELNNVSFQEKTSLYYQENVDLPFFNYYLKDKGTLDLPEVLAFSTGSNQWHRLDSWPPAQAQPVSFYLRAGGKLDLQAPASGEGAYNAYLSDPAKPVPYTSEIRIGRSREYMTEDQRFAARRPDVLVYQSDVLEEDVTVAGPLSVNLFISTTGTDADFIVKLIDVYPDDAAEHEEPADKYMPNPMSGYQMMVRGEVFRAKFRNSLETPEPLTPGEVTPIRFDTPDIFHTFKAGHRAMVQVQSSWFPLVDRNPQTFVDIYKAKASDFQQATHRVYHSSQYPSHVRIGRMPN